MKVALLTREYPPEVYGGAGVHVEYLVPELARQVEIGVHCFGAPRDSPYVAASYGPATPHPEARHPHTPAPLGEEPYESALEALSVNLEMAHGVKGADIVHSHTWYTNFGGHLAKTIHDIPHVMTSHSLEPLRPWKAEQLGGGYALSQFCERTALESADAVIAVSQGMRRDLLECYPAVDPALVHVIHNGIDVDEYSPTASSDAVERLGVDRTRPFVVFIGRITRQKGITYLLEAAPAIDAATQIVFAAGAADTIAFAEEVQGLVSEVSEKRKGIVWIEKTLPRTEIVQLLSHATAFVCPSIYEPFGLVNLEAMACGLPVVATSTGGIPEIVLNGETGLLVGFERGDDQFGSPRDPAAFARDIAARVNELIGDPARAKRLGEAGRRRVVDHFSWPSIADQAVALYKSLA